MVNGMTAEAIQSALIEISGECDPALKHPSSCMKKPKLSKSGVPTIPMNEPMRWEDWLRGRQARRFTGQRVAPDVIRRPSSSSDKRLRRLYNGQRGLPFKQAEEL